MKHFTIKSLLIMLLMMIGGGSVNVWANDVVYKTALFGSTYNSEKISSYTDSWSATNDGFKVNLQNWNNYNNGWDYIKAGSKKATSVATITTDAAIGIAITKVVLTIDAITATSVNSIKLYSGDTKDKITTEEGEFTCEKNAQTVTIKTPAANKFYQIKVDCKKAKNGVVQVSKVEFYCDASAPIVTLSSITISGEPTKKTYVDGDTFDPAGLVVTGTYTDNTKEDITSKVEWTLNPKALSLGTTSVEVRASVGDVVSEVYEVNGLTVNPVVDSGSETVDFTQVYNKLSGNQNEEIKSYVGKNFSMAFEKPENSKTPTKYYANGTAVRAYKENTITITSEQNIMGVKVNYVSSYVDDGEKVDGLGTKTVVITSSKTCRFTSITVYFKSIGLSATDGTDYYATFSSDKSVEFVDAKVYTADVQEGALVLNEINNKQVPANTGVLVMSKGQSALYTFLSVEPTLEGTNLLFPASETMSGSNKFYKLAYKDFENKSGLCFMWGAENGGVFNVKAGTAYLAVPESAAADVRAFVFGDNDVTAIKGIETETGNQVMFDLSGRKVSRAQKGIYIVNGRKVVK